MPEKSKSTDDQIIQHVKDAIAWGLIGNGDAKEFCIFLAEMPVDELYQTTDKQVGKWIRQKFGEAD